MIIIKNKMLLNILFYCCWVPFQTKIHFDLVFPSIMSIIDINHLDEQGPYEGRKCIVVVGEKAISCQKYCQ